MRRCPGAPALGSTALTPPRICGTPLSPAGGRGGERGRGEGWSPPQPTARRRSLSYVAPPALVVNQPTTLDNRTPYQRFGIYVVPAVGGEPRKITEGSEGVSWSPDGKTLAVAGLPPESAGIFLAEVKTGKRILLARSGQNLDEFPIFPDGRWIAFTRSFDWSESELFVVRAQGGGAARQLTSDHRPVYGEAWTADSKEIVFSSNRGGGSESLWHIPIAGGAPRRVSATLWGAYYPAISRQGDRLLYTESYEDTNIYSSDGAGFAGRFAPGHFTTPRPLIASSRRDDSPNISPTDDRIAFVSTRTGDEEIWVCDWNGGHPRQLTSFAQPVTGTPRWSPDGRWIAFDSVALAIPISTS